MLFFSTKFSFGERERERERERDFWEKKINEECYYFY